MVISNDREFKVALAELPAARQRQAASTARVESFTQRGRQTDWTAQAGDFVAKPAVACVKPAEAGNLSWEAAMQARMARTCRNVAEVPVPRAAKPRSNTASSKRF